MVGARVSTGIHLAVLMKSKANLKGKELVHHPTYACSLRHQMTKPSRHKQFNLPPKKLQILAWQKRLASSFWWTDFAQKGKVICRGTY